MLSMPIGICLQVSYITRSVQFQNVYSPSQISSLYRNLNSTIRFSFVRILIWSLITDHVESPKRRAHRPVPDVPDYQGLCIGKTVYTL